MRKYNLSNFKKYKLDSITIEYCDIANDSCTARDSPSNVGKYFIYDGNGNSQQINICKNCSVELSKLVNIQK